MSHNTRYSVSSISTIFQNALIEGIIEEYTTDTLDQGSGSGSVSESWNGDGTVVLKEKTKTELQSKMRDTEPLDCSFPRTYINRTYNLFASIQIDKSEFEKIPPAFQKDVTVDVNQGNG